MLTTCIYVFGDYIESSKLNSDNISYVDSESGIISVPAGSYTTVYFDIKPPSENTVIASIIANPNVNKDLIWVEPCRPKSNTSAEVMVFNRHSSAIGGFYIECRILLLDLSINFPSL